MRDRWKPIVLLAAALFAVNAVARLVIRFGPSDAKVQDSIILGSLAVSGLFLAVVAFAWGRHYPAGRWTSDAAIAILLSMAVNVLIGPFVSGNHPFSNGVGAFFTQIWMYAGFTAGGALIGYLLSVAFGLDYRSQSLKRYAETVKAKPRRVVRR